MNSALIDTNLLVLLIVGFTDVNLIEKHKRTNRFVKEDFNLLIEQLKPFEMIWVTSHCLAEASNLLKQTASGNSYNLLFTLKEYTSKFKESHINKDSIFASSIFTRLGVADTGIINKSKKVNCVFTVDFHLYNEILRVGRNVINFNHLRTEMLIS